MNFEKQFPSMENFRNKLDEHKYFYSQSMTIPKFFDEYQIKKTCIDKQKILRAIKNNTREIEVAGNVYDMDGHDMDVLDVNGFKKELGLK